MHGIDSGHRSGAPQVYIVSGINDENLPQDITASKELFDAAAKQDGVVVMSLELPVVTTEATARKNWMMLFD